MGIYTRLIRHMLFRFDPEWIHDQTLKIAALSGEVDAISRILSWNYRFRDPVLRTMIGGVKFDNPLGLSAGFDKNGKAVRAMACLGFGHLEIGSVSADRSAGNPKPRLSRLLRDQAILVHYGLPNDGAEVVARRLRDLSLQVPLGINIVKTNRGMQAEPDTDGAIIADYVRSVRILKDRADYLNLNLSCPNTETGRDFFEDTGNLARLLVSLEELHIRCPVFLKISPLGGPGQLDKILLAVKSASFVSGFAFNLAPGKPVGLKTPHAQIASLPGAISGKPIEQQMNQAISELYRRMNRKRYRIIGIGGVFSAEDAYRKIRLGASLVQLMTSLIYEGPALVNQINRGLCELLRRDGFQHVGQAVGTAHTLL